MPWPDTKIAALAMLLTATGAASAAPAPCPGPALPIRALADGVWLISGSTGDSNAINQGRISNLLAVREGRRLWLLGSGPDARFARALDCQLARQAGRRVHPLHIASPSAFCGWLEAINMAASPCGRRPENGWLQNVDKASPFGRRGPFP